MAIALFSGSGPSTDLVDALGEVQVIGPNWLISLGDEAKAKKIQSLLGGTVSSGSQPPLPTSTTSPSIGTPSSTPAAQSLPSGIYVDGEQGTPHYFITLTSNSDGTLSGTVSFLAQDGQTSAVFTFTATTQSGVATLTPSSGLNTISAPYGDRQMTLGNCTTYLQFAQSNADCSFAFSPSGLQ